MTDKKSILDELQVDDHKSKNNDPKHQKNNKVAKRIMYGVAGLALAAGAGVGINSVVNDNAKADDDVDNDLKDVKQEHREDPYKHLSEVKAEKVKAADEAVTKVVDAVSDKKSDAEIKTVTEEADKVVAAIADDKSDADMKAVQTAYADVVNVTKDPTIENLQTARTHIANMPDSTISKDMEDKYEDKLIDTVADKTNKPKKEVDKESKPLTPQQDQAKADKAKADKEAADKAAADKAKADKEAADKAAADKAAADQAAADKAAADKAAADQANAGGTYTPPATDNGGTYTPPATDNGGTYTPPATGGASDNQAAQDAANNTQTPTPPAQDGSYDKTGGGTVGNDSPNGGYIPGGW